MMNVKMIIPFVQIFRSSLDTTRPALMWKAVAMTATLAVSTTVQAHFQELIPSPEMVTADSGNRVGLALVFTHTMERGPAMEMGEPVPFAEVEVEWRNDGSLMPPADPFITQVLKADANGVFSYAMPRAGWWGFAALFEGDTPMQSPEGKEVPVEMAALIWVHVRDMR